MACFYMLSGDVWQKGVPSLGGLFRPSPMPHRFGMHPLCICGIVGVGSQPKGGFELDLRIFERSFGVQFEWNFRSVEF